MNKKIIVFLVVALIILIGSTIFLPLLLRLKNQPSYQPSSTMPQPTINLSISSIEDQIKQKLPQETSDFKIEYSVTQNKVVATKKTPQADQKIDQWLTENNLSDLKNQPEIFIIKNNPEISQSLPSASPTINPLITLSITPSSDQNTKLLVDLLSILLSLGNTNSENTVPTPLLSVSPKTTISPSGKPGKPSGGFVYYSQCGGSFDSYPLPLGCTVCKAGCGPTTVAMIAASYVDKNITPKTIVDLYQKKGYFLGCDGSRYSDAKNALASYGIKTTDYLVYSYSTINQTAADFKNYIKSGWTIFVLASYCDGGCGHFFWITDVSSNNDTWAYDPYYGRFQKPPYNEKNRYPFPKYRIAFGVKK